MDAYTDSITHLQEELERLDLILQLHFEELGAELETTGEGLDGMYVSDEEVAQLLQSDRNRQRTTNNALRQQIDDRAAHLKERVAESFKEGTPIRFAAFADNFGLSRLELDALLLALAPEIDEKYEKIYSYLLDDITSKRPTVGLILRVLSHSERERIGSLTVFSSSSPLIDEDLVTLHPESRDVPRLSKEVYVDRHIAEFLIGDDGLDATIAEYATLEESTAWIDDLLLEKQTHKRLEGVCRDQNPQPTVYYLHGPSGSGRSTAAEAIATSLDVPRLVVDAVDLVDQALSGALMRLRREMRLRGCALQIENVDVFQQYEDVPVSLDGLLEQLEGLDRHVFLIGRDSWTPSRQLTTHEFVTLQVQRPSYPRRREIWNEYADMLPDEVDTDELASKFTLTRGEIETALFNAQGFTNGDDLTRDAVYRGCRTQSSEKLEELARKTEPGYDWGDIILPPDKKQQLREIEAHVRHRGTVYSDWGFEEKFSLGNGLSILFSGPSGTGKTMSAEIIAGNTGLDLYKADLAGIVSKYIGETEKNLGKIFDEAEHSNAILFFDEADALFGQRSEVSDAQDRYANIEVNYLLQRIEEHDGTVVMTTNFEQNIDDAFMRRLDVSIDFPRPGRESRCEIWKQIFPDETPVGDLDYQFLSQFDLTGGNIKNIAQTAAFLAADEDGVVGMAQVVIATKLELQKIGKLVNPSDFGEYQDLLRR